jgi:hypothetical protein
MAVVEKNTNNKTDDAEDVCNSTAAIKCSRRAWLFVILLCCMSCLQQYYRLIYVRLPSVVFHVLLSSEELAG